MANVTESTTKTKSKRIFYFDALRALAIIAVIIIHLFSETMSLVMNGYYPFHSVQWIISDGLGVCFRFGVDLFLMLSGALTLGRNWSVRALLGRRLPRIIKPFIFWGFVLSTLQIIVVLIFPNFIPVPSSFTITSYLQYLYSFYMAKGLSSAPYWFFWMILGTYLIMPIFNRWLEHSKLEEAEYFLVLWLITCIFDFTLGFEFPIKLTYFVSPIGLVVLGYYLRNTKRNILNNPYFAIALTFLPAIVMMILSYVYSVPTRFFTFNRYSIFMSLEVAGVFLLFKNAGKFNLEVRFFTNPEGIFRKAIATLARYSYGLYLTHAFVLILITKFLNHYAVYTMIPFSLYLLIIFVGTIVIAIFGMYILKHIPYIKGYMGVK